MIHVYDHKKVLHKTLDGKICEYVLSCDGSKVKGEEPRYVNKTTTEWRGSNPTVATALWEQATCPRCLQVQYGVLCKNVLDLTDRMKILKVEVMP